MLAAELVYQQNAPSENCITLTNVFMFLDAIYNIVLI